MPTKRNETENLSMFLNKTGAPCLRPEPDPGVLTSKQSFSPPCFHYNTKDVYIILVHRLLPQNGDGKNNFGQSQMSHGRKAMGKHKL
jgi:hypothetical protein